MFLYIFGDMLNEAPQGYSDLAKKLRNNMKHIICVLLNKIYEGEGIDFFPLNISILIDKPIVLLMYLLTQKFLYKKNIIELLEKIIKILITENIQTNSKEISNLILELFNIQTLAERNINSTIDNSTLAAFYKYKIDFKNESRSRADTTDSGIFDMQ